jgi:hypothetical protein
MLRHPSNIPLEKWPSGWLKLECASKLNMPFYIAMHDWEKRDKGLPVTDEEMRTFINDA